MRRKYKKMKKTYYVTIEIEIPKEFEGKAYSDEQNIADITELLLDEMPENVNPKITVEVKK